MQLFSELKRRNVFRVAVAYTVVAWVIVQVADVVLENIGAPPWVIQSLFLLLALGFVLAVGISWAYEITPDGLKRDGDFVPEKSFQHEIAKRLDIITICLLIIAIGLLVSDRLWERSPAGNGDQELVEVTALGSASPSSSEIQANEAPEEVVDQSIAVMPFIALTAQEDDAFFGKGVAEELLNSLAKIPELKVAARTSAFALADEDRDLREVGETLNVAHVLEGSIRRSGDRIRITAQLIRTSDGFHLWSETYEREFNEIFAIQDEIVGELSRVLQIRLGVGAGAGRAANLQVLPEAYELYLRGLDYWWTRSTEGHRALAIRSFLHATELDPEFADAWAAYAVSIALSNPNYAPHVEPDQIIEHVSAAFNRALELDPDNARALAGLVYFHIYRKIDITAASQHLSKALAVSANSGFTQYAAAQYYFMVGDEAKAIRAINRALVADPLNQTLQRIDFQHDSAFGNFDPEAPALKELEACTQTDCGPGDWLIAWSAMVSVLHSGDEREIRRIKNVFQAVYEALGGAGEFSRDAYQFLLTYADTVLGTDPGTAYWAETDFQSLGTVGIFAMDASILAQMGRNEDAIAILQELANTDRFFSSRGVNYVLSPGRFALPDQIRRDPRYHQIWTRPGMPEIELARRSNGQEYGLPLGIEAVSR